MPKTEASRISAGNRVRELADDAAAVRSELQKILESAEFRSSHRSKIFLSHIVETALAGSFNELKERLVGAALFGRAADYDTGADAIVRVVANDTRRRLQAYFARPGNALEARILLPAGSYIPTFDFKPASVEEPLDSVTESARAGQSHRLWVLAALIAGLTVATSVLAVQNRSLRSQLAARTTASAKLSQPWAALLTGGHGIQILLADTSVGAIQNLRQAQLPLSDYVNRRYIPGDEPVTPELKSFFDFLLASQYTSASYASTAVRIAQLAQTHSVPASVSFARDMSLRTFQGGDSFVVLGTSRANPWVQLFDSQLNFSVEFSKARAEPGLRNRSPRAGEAAIYLPSRTDASMRESYGHIAFLPSLYQGGHILLVTGTSSESTEAAGDFVTNSRRISEALANLGINPASEPRFFELLLEVRSTAGAPIQSQVISGRINSP